MPGKPGIFICMCLRVQRRPTAELGVEFELPLPPGVDPGPVPEGALVTLPPVAGAEPITLLLPPRPPFKPVPGCAVWLRPLASLVPLPVVPGKTSPPEEPVCGAEPAMPEGPPGGPSGAAGRTTSVALPVPGLPGAFGLVCACLLHATSVSAQAATSVAKDQACRFMPGLA
jgi:hypothetical protein